MTLRELANANNKLDGLLDGIQGHLEMLKTSLPEHLAAPAASAQRGAAMRVVTPLYEDPDVL